MTKARIMTKASLRLMATTDMTPVQIQMSTVLYHLKQHKLKSEFTDDDKDMIVVKGNLAHVLMGLSGLGWSIGDEEEMQGGVYCNGSAVTVQAQQPLRLMQTAIDRVIICPVRTQ